MKKSLRFLSIFLLILCLTGCTVNIDTDKQTQTQVQTEPPKQIAESPINIIEAQYFDGNPSVMLNAGIPYFTKDEITTESFESYSELDELGRCGVAFACIGTDIMPTEERGEIGSVKPSGWNQAKYAGIDGNYLYNRCHLIAYSLTGENANKKNLITGTRYLNISGMLEYEMQVLNYVSKTNNHVMYRVTPVFKDNNLLAEGVIIEAYSVEDYGSGVQFCVFCYNVQPGVTINYADGSSTGPEFTGSEK